LLEPKAGGWSAASCSSAASPKPARFLLGPEAMARFNGIQLTFRSGIWNFGRVCRMCPGGRARTRFERLLRYQVRTRRFERPAGLQHGRHYALVLHAHRAQHRHFGRQPLAIRTVMRSAPDPSCRCASSRPTCTSNSPGGISRNRSVFTRRCFSSSARSNSRSFSRVRCRSRPSRLDAPSCALRARYPRPATLLKNICRWRMPSLYNARSSPSAARAAPGFAQLPTAEIRSHSCGWKPVRPPILPARALPRDCAPWITGRQNHQHA